MKNVLKAAGFTAMCIGILMIETYDLLGMQVAGAGFLAGLAGFWLEAIDDIRMENRRRNEEWRAEFMS